MRFSKKLLSLAEILAFSAGGFVFWQLLRVTGLEALKQAWDAAGLRLAAVFALYPFMTFWDVAAWRNVFGGPRPRFLPLFWIRMAGEAVNNVTPGVDIGGEPLKIKWLGERLGIAAPRATSATIVGKTSTLVSEILFLWMGVAAAWSFLPWPQGTRGVFLTAAAVVTGLVASLFFFQSTRLFGSWSPGTREFYRRFMPRFAGSVALNLGGWISGAVELWAFSWILGDPMEWRQAFVLEALVQLIRLASFFIPGNVGTQEAGYVFLTHLMGYEPSAGMALSLLKRARQIAWTAVGFGVWGAFQCERVSARVYEASEPIFDTALDRIFHRPPARFLARRLAPLRVSPNLVTFSSLVPAFAAAFFLAQGTALGQALGLFCFYAWAVLEHADGEVARIQRRQSAFGCFLDDACDAVASTAILLGLWTGLSLFWSPQDLRVLNRLFYPALIFNAAASLLALAVKRDEKAPRESRRWMELLTGREPFYFCLVVALAAVTTGHPALYAFLGGFLVIGQIFLFLIAAYTFMKNSGRTS